MNTTVKQTSLNLGEIQKFFLGFDRQKELWATMYHDLGTQYPRYNIISQKTGYKIVMAVPGRAQEDMAIQLVNNNLIIKGAATTGLFNDDEYICKGISGKDFTKTFQVADNLKVTEAKMTNGLLVIELMFKEDPVYTIDIVIE